MTAARDGGGQMHQRRHAAEHALGVIDQPHELAQVGLAAQIDDVFQGRMMMSDFAHLDEEHAVSEMIDDVLVASPVPPLDGVVKLSTGVDDPKRQVAPAQFMHDRFPPALLGGQMNVAAEKRRTDVEPQAGAEEVGETVDAVVGRFVAAVDERVVTVNLLNAAVGFAERREVGIVVPQFGARSTDIGEKPVRKTVVQIAYGGGQRSLRR